MTTTTTITTDETRGKAAYTLTYDGRYSLIAEPDFGGMTIEALKAKGRRRLDEVGLGGPVFIAERISPDDDFRTG